MKPNSFLPKVEGRQEKAVEWLMSAYILSFKGSAWRPSQQDPVVIQ